MSAAPNYTYTQEQVTAAFDEIKATLFSGITAEATPKMLIAAGLQGSGKTYLLEKVFCLRAAIKTTCAFTCSNTGKNTLSTPR